MRQWQSVPDGRIAGRDNKKSYLFFWLVSRVTTRAPDGLLRARPAHTLSHEIPAKKINTIFGCRARQLDCPANSAAVACENIAHSNPAKNKYRSGPVFFVVALGNISFNVSVTPHLRGVSCDQMSFGHDNELIYAVRAILYVLQV